MLTGHRPPTTDHYPARADVAESCIDPYAPCACRKPAPGHGLVEVARVAGRTAVVRARADSPLKLLAPRGRARSAWVFASTYGGGLVAGDDVRLRVKVGPGATLLLGTQASTKVYRSTDGRVTRQALGATVADGGLLVVAPDPLTPFAGAVHEQRQRVDLAPGGSLVLLDWITSGRRARGERWAFGRYASRNDVYQGGVHALADRLALDPADGPLDAPSRLGRFECLALVVIIGPQLAGASKLVLDEVGSRPLRRRETLVDAASPLRDGVVLRVAAEATELLGRYLRETLAFVPELLGEDPWARKW
jgi:urease accessory protein